MAWHYIDMACGHEERHQIYGPEIGRPRQARFIARGDCEECVDKARKDRVAYLASPQAYEATTSAVAEKGWPQLEGSPKQIVWASEIRERLLIDLSQDDKETLLTIKLASWWIENRSSRGLGCTAKKMRE